MSFSVVTPFDETNQQTKTNEIVYKVAENRREREGAFRLVHDAYVRAGLMEARTDRMRITPYHLLPTTDVFIATLREEVICTVTLVRDEEMGLPMESIYDEEVGRLRTLGVSLAEVSALADRRAHVRRIIPVLVELIRLVGQFARHHGVEQVLVASHPRHARFYERNLYFHRFGQEKNYPMVQNHPAVACRLDFEQARLEHPQAYEMYFGTSFPLERLQSRPMCRSDLKYFGPMTEQDPPATSVHPVSYPGQVGQQALSSALAPRASM